MFMDSMGQEAGQSIVRVAYFSSMTSEFSAGRLKSLRIESFESLLTFMSGDCYWLKAEVLSFPPCGPLHVVSTWRLVKASLKHGDCFPQSCKHPPKRDT